MTASIEDRLPSASIKFLRDIYPENSGTHVTAFAWSPNGAMIAFATDDGIIQIVNLQSGAIDATFAAEGKVWEIKWSPNASIIAYCVAEMATVYLINVRKLEFHAQLFEPIGTVTGISWHPNGRSLAVAYSGWSVRVWDLAGQEPRPATEAMRQHMINVTERFVSTNEIQYGENNSIMSVSWSGDGSWLAYGTNPWHIMLFNAKSGRTYKLKTSDHSIPLGLAWSANSRLLAAACSDSTIRIWDVPKRRQIQVLEGHTNEAYGLSFSPDSYIMASASWDGTVRLWRTDTWEQVALIEQPTGMNDVLTVGFHPVESIIAALDDQAKAIRTWSIDTDLLLGAASVAHSIHYSNSRVVLVGDTGVGKTGLSLALTSQQFVPTESTHGRFVWTLDSQQVTLQDGRRATRETMLWDLAGQPGYRVFHRQSLDEVAVALVLFDSRSETDPFSGVAFWARALDEARRGFPLVKILVASKSDRGGPSVSNERIEQVVQDYGFKRYLETSARRGKGIAELRQTIANAINWDHMPKVSSPELFYNMKTFLMNEKKRGYVLQRQSDIISRFRESNEMLDVPDDAFDTCVGRLEATGLVKRLSFGGFVLLQPEMLDNYSAWLALAARSEPDGLGFISEEQARKCDFDMDEERRLKNAEEERLLVTATIEDVVARGIALRQPTDRGQMIIFPTELRSDMLEYPEKFVKAVIFRFDGEVRAIYAIIAVSIAHAPAFSNARFFRNTAIVDSASGEQCGFKVEYINAANETKGELVAFFSPGTSRTTKLTFLRYINHHLGAMAFGGRVSQQMVYQCDCDYIVPQDVVEKRLAMGKATVLCSICENHMPIDNLANQSAKKDSISGEQIALASEERNRQSRLAILSEREREGEFHVFLCHNSRDKGEVRVLASRLRDQGILAWLDEEEIFAGDQFVPLLEDAIDRSSAVAIVVGRYGTGPWQEQEYFAFLQKYVEDRSRRRRMAVIPVLLPSTGGRIPDLPRFLRGFNWVKFTGTLGMDDPDEMRKLVGGIMRSHGS